MMRIVAIVGRLGGGAPGPIHERVRRRIPGIHGIRYIAQSLWGASAILALSMDCSFCYYQRDPWRWASLCVGLRTEFCGNVSRTGNHAAAEPRVSYFWLDPYAGESLFGHLPSSLVSSR